MATLESGFNPTYSENASILTGNPNRVTVEVEDTIDRDFWSDLLEELCPEKEFHFDPYHTILNEDGSSERTGKGKSQIINASADFNAWHIGCVDSDYDWILSDYTDAGKTISGNKYLTTYRGRVIGNVSSMKGKTSSCIIGSEKIYDYSLKELYDYAKEDYAYYICIGDTILFRKIEDEKTILYRYGDGGMHKIAELSNVSLNIYSAYLYSVHESEAYTLYNRFGGRIMTSSTGFDYYGNTDYMVVRTQNDGEYNYFILH